MSLITSVNVRIENRDGVWIAHSDDVKGLNLVGSRKADVLEDIPNAIKYLYSENNNLEVQVSRMVQPSAFSDPRPVFEPDKFAVTRLAAAA